MVLLHLLLGQLMCCACPAHKQAQIWAGSLVEGPRVDAESSEVCEMQLELCVNMFGHWWQLFWNDGWNIFDFVVVSPLSPKTKSPSALHPRNPKPETRNPKPFITRLHISFGPSRARECKDYGSTSCFLLADSHDNAGCAGYERRSPYPRLQGLSLEPSYGAMEHFIESPPSSGTWRLASRDEG